MRKKIKWESLELSRTKLILAISFLIFFVVAFGMMVYLVVSKSKMNSQVAIVLPPADKEAATVINKTEIFNVVCFNGCSLETKLLILSTAQKTLENFEKEFPWMAERSLKNYYIIEVNPANNNASGRSYVDFKTRTVKLTRIYVPTIAHEISHLLIAESFGLEEEKSLSETIYPKGHTWLHEGIAMYLEYLVDDSRRAADITLLKSTSQFLNKEQLMRGDTEGSLKLFYAQSWSLTDFLIKKGGKERLQLMIEEIHKHPRREQICRDWYISSDFSKTCVSSEMVIFPFWEEFFDKTYRDITAGWDYFYQDWIKYAKQT